MQIIDFAVQRQNTAKAKTNILGGFLPEWKPEIFHFLVEKNIELNWKPDVSLCFIFNKNKIKRRDSHKTSMEEIFHFYLVWQTFPDHRITESFNSEGTSGHNLGYPLCSKWGRGEHPNLKNRFYTVPHFPQDLDVDNHSTFLPTGLQCRTKPEWLQEGWSGHETSRRD